LFVFEMHRVSISPMCIRSPGAFNWIAAEPLENTTSICHAVAVGAASCQINVGGVISGGKIEPSSG
jgi:hypothetical protein